MELISLESAEEAQQLADYLRPGKFLRIPAIYMMLSIELDKLPP